MKLSFYELDSVNHILKYIVFNLIIGMDGCIKINVEKQYSSCLA